MMFSAVRFFSFHQDVARVLSVFETHFYFSKQASKTPKNQVMQHEKKGGWCRFLLFFPARIGFSLICKIQQIVNTGIIKFSKTF